MKILMISDVYFPRVNGVSTSINTFINELNILDHEVILIAPEYNGHGDTLFDVENNIIRIPARQVPFDPEDRIMNSREIKKLLNYLHKKDFDVIHIHTPFVAHYLGVWLAKHLNIPSLETYHTFFEEYLHHYIPLAPRILTRSLAKYISAKECNQVDQIIVPSSAMKDILVTYGVTTNINILPTGIPLRQFNTGKGERFKTKHKIDPSRPVMVTVGRVAYEKNLNFLLEVLLEVKNKINDILFVIAGEGPMLPNLKHWVQRNKVEHNVRFVGYLNRKNELQDCYRAADTFVFASRTETQGLVLLEAMTEGLPVVSTAVMGTKDVLFDQHGCLVSKEDVKEFSGKIIDVLTKKELKENLSVSGKTYAKKWTANYFAEKLINLYMEMSNKPKKLSPNPELRQLSKTA